MLAAGTTYQTTAGAWQSGNLHATSNQVNGVNTGATDFRITGVQITEGLVQGHGFSLYGDTSSGELQVAQRYYSTGIAAAGSEAFNANTVAREIYTPVNFPCTMRGTPNVTVTEIISANVNISDGFTAALSIQPEGFRFYIVRGVDGVFNATRRYRADAEL